MSASHIHTPHHALPSGAGWSLLRLSALQRLGLAAIVAALVWAAVLAVIL